MTFWSFTLLAKSRRIPDSQRRRDDDGAHEYLRDTYIQTRFGLDGDVTNLRFSIWPELRQNSGHKM